MAHSLQTDRCCGSPVQVVTLTGDKAVELVRCASCGLSAWRLDGRSVDKDEALGALSTAYAPAQPHRRAEPVRHRPPAPSTAPPEDVSRLLAGWRVLGSTD
jgi:hypothetical protein